MSVVDMRNITKRFPNIIANFRVNLSVKSGEIHALLGENGAGKTTLMNILFGLYSPDEGEVYVKGKREEIRSPRDAIRLGVGMVHQHFKLVDTNTVAENIALGLTSKSHKIPYKILHLFQNPLPDVELRIKELSKTYGLEVDPRARIWQLSAGERQRVEIIKALYRGSDILILDEPTTVLTLGEVKTLFEALKTMRDDGCSIIFITHKLDEVFEVADRVTVLRGGRVVGHVMVSETSKRELAKMMVGREVLFRLKRERLERGEPMLRVTDLHTLSDRGFPALNGVSFAVYSGEILSIAGVAGNGQKELVEVITGLRKATTGKVMVMGRDVTNRSPREIAELDVAHIPEERIRLGIVPDMSVAENLILRNYYKPPICKGILLDLPRTVDEAKRLIREYEVITPTHATPAKLLSGGNLQRVILARELSGEPRIVVAAHPTYGLDVGATEYIRQRLLGEKRRGAAVLLVSEDLDEVVSLSDRIVIMVKGQIMGELSAEEADSETIGLMMGGEKI